MFLIKKFNFKCVKCYKEKLNIDWQMMEEPWESSIYSTLFCPFCNKNQFAPFEIWNIKSKR